MRATEFTERFLSEDNCCSLVVMKQMTIPSTKWKKHLSDLLDTHQDRPTEVRHRDQVKIITTPWTETQTLRTARVTVEAGVKRLHFRASRT